MPLPMPNSRHEGLDSKTPPAPTHLVRKSLQNENVESPRVDTFAREHLPPRELWPAMNGGDLPEFNYPSCLNAAAELLDGMVEKGFGVCPCLRSEDGVWSYAKLLDRSNRIANLLVYEGLLAGERVLLRDANTPMLAACWFGVLRAGGIAVTTMPQLRAHELSAIVNKARTRFALCAELLAEELHKTRQVASALEKVILYGRENDQEGPAEFIAAQPGEFAAVRTSSDDVALIAFSSGTSGEPKATLHFHRDLLAVCDSFSKYVLKPRPEDIFCGSPPLAFTFGLGGLLLFPMRIGASTLLLPKVTAEGLLGSIERHGCTICFTAPTLYRRMLEHVPRFKLASLKKCVSAGEHLPIAVFQAWQEATGISIIDGIGSTELLHIFISAAYKQIRPGATGRPVPGY